MVKASCFSPPFYNNSGMTMTATLNNGTKWNSQCYIREKGTCKTKTTGTESVSRKPQQKLSYHCQQTSKSLETTKANVNQFRHISCQQALHTLQSALILRCQHGQAAYALFMDLVKAFNTVNQTILLNLLSKYRIPPQMIMTIKKSTWTISCCSSSEKKHVKLTTNWWSNKEPTWPQLFSIHASSNWNFSIKTYLQQTQL